MTATFDLKEKVDLYYIQMMGGEGEGVITYRPERFNALIIRYKDPKATTLVFDSGKVVCVGARTEEIAKTVSQKCYKMIKDLDFPVHFENFKIHNYVASWETGRNLSLRHFARRYRKYSSYEPELFPGCIYEAKNKGKVLIFHTGKVILTGIKKKEDVEEVYEFLLPRLKKFVRKRKKTSINTG